MARNVPSGRGKRSLTSGLPLHHLTVIPRGAEQSDRVHGREAEQPGKGGTCPRAYVTQMHTLEMIDVNGRTTRVTVTGAI